MARGRIRKRVERGLWRVIAAVGVKDAHLVFYAADGDVAFRAIGFDQGSRLLELVGPGTRLSIAFRLKQDKTRDRGAVELEILDFKVA